MNGLYAAKAWYTRRLAPVTAAAVRRQVNPDVFTAAGVLAAVAAGAALLGHAGWLVGVFLAARLAGANLDGAVARARGVARPWGFVVNELGDRAADLIVFAAVAAAVPAALTALAWAAAAAATLPTFVSLAAAGAGVPRINGGPIGKTERCVAITVGAILPAAWPVVLFTVIAGSLLTAALRVRAAHRTVTAGAR